MEIVLLWYCDVTGSYYADMEKARVQMGGRRRPRPQYFIRAKFGDKVKYFVLTQEQPNIEG